ncbi:MAG: polymer-forming cytoskeletal protein [Devosia sp.]
MMRYGIGLVSLTALLVIALPLGSNAEDTGVFHHGGDVYAVGKAANLGRGAERSAYLAGGEVETEVQIGRDAHIVGFDVDVNAPVLGDVLAAGAFVTLDAKVDGDVSAAGFNVTVKDHAEVGGNLRAVGRTVSLDGTLQGSALVAAANLVVNGPVAGDVVFAGQALSFGPNAAIAGTLSYRTPSAVDVPAAVVPMDRVRYEPFSPPDFAKEIGAGAREAFDFEGPSAWTVAAVALAAILAIVMVGVLFLGLAPQSIERLRDTIESRLWRSFVFGLLGLATLLGLVPLAALTVVGLPLIPLIIFAAGLLSVFAYLLGAYALAHRVFRSFGASQASTGARLVTFVVGVVVLLALNVVPILGWLINAFAALIGFGALEMRVVARLERATHKRTANTHPSGVQSA